MNKLKILIVEDETIVALDMKSALLKLDYDITDTVTNYMDAMDSIHENMPDLVMMDIHLKDSQDGIETAKAIKKINRNIAIIYLTAYSDDDTISRAVKTDPLAYLIKPFKREELKTTIRLVLHKMNSEERKFNEKHKPLGFGYYYDMQNENLFYKNLPIKISYKENLLLRMLIEAKGNIVTFKELEYHIWPDDPISNSTLRTLIYRLRSKLEHKIIETVPSIGCRIVF